MKTYLGLTQEVLCRGPSVVTIGLFDGLHQGHQHLLRKAKECAVEKQASLVVVTFRSLPRVEHSLILTPYHKKTLLERFGVDILVELWFSPEIKNLSPSSFLSAIETMFPSSTWVVGEDTQFGVDRTGTVEFLRRHASGGVQEVKNYFKNEFSSTVVRDCIKSGEISRVSFLLGRSYSVMAKAEFTEKSLLKIYPNKLKNWDFADAEHAGFDPEKTGPPLTIGPVFSGSKIECSAKVKTNSSACLGIDAKELCLPPSGEWLSFVRLEADETEIACRLFISEQQEVIVDLGRSYVLPRTLFVEVVPHSHILT